MKRIDENPPARFPYRPIVEAPYRWWVAKLKPRQEKACAFDFMRYDIEYYLPLITRVTRRRDNNKPRKSVAPLFPGYICFNMPQPENIFTRGRVVTIVEIRNQRRFVTELTWIYTALEGGLPLEPVTERFEEGEAVYVHSGPLRGVRGVVARIRDADRLILSVEALGMASVTIDRAFVRPA